MAPYSGMSRMRNPKPSPNMYYPQNEGQPLMPPMPQMRMNQPSYLDDRQMGSPCGYPRMPMGGTPPEFKSPPMMPTMTEPAGPAPKKKRRNAASAAAQAAPQPAPPVMDIMPPPLTGYGDTIVASNPFDDSPSHPPPMMMPHMRHMQPTAPPAMSSPLMPGPMSPMMRSPLQDNMMGGPPNMPIMMSPMGPQTMPNMQPQQQQPPQQQQQQQQPPPPPFSQMAPKPMPVTTGKVYPPDQPMVFNPQNPNAPPIYPCGVCHKEVHDNDQAILCESGCNFWFHRICTGLTEAAFQMLTAEVYAEWVCDKCVNSKNIPLVKCKP